MAPDEIPGAEWRAIVIEKLNSLEREVRKIGDNFVRQDECDLCQSDNSDRFDKIEKRVRSVELTRARLLGVVATLQVVGNAVLYYFLKR